MSSSCWGHGQRQSASAQECTGVTSRGQRAAAEKRTSTPAVPDRRPACPPPARRRTFAPSVRWPRRACLCRAPGAQGSDGRERPEAQTDTGGLRPGPSPPRGCTASVAGSVRWHF